MGASSPRGSAGECVCVCVCVCVCGKGVVQGKPCLRVLITAPAACVAPLFHVAIRSNSFVEKEHL